MPQEMKMSFIGLANWNENLFRDMNWPDAFLGETPDLDKDAFLYELYARTAELEVIYPDPNIMQQMINLWSRTRVPIWNHLWSTTLYEYNPIDNYNRIEEGTDTDTHSGTDESSNELARTGSDTRTDSASSTEQEAAYNTPTGGETLGLTPTRKMDSESESETEYGSTDTTTGSMTYGHEIAREHELRIHGNIGVTTTQEMIKQEREIAQFSLYDVMIRDFMDRFCTLVY